MTMALLLIITTISLFLSFILDRKKTYEGLRNAYHKFLNIFPHLIMITLSVSIVLYFVTGDAIAEYLIDNSILLGTITGAFLGSVSTMPGFIAFPIAGILKHNGVPYTIVSAFTTTLMIVGILTFPIEKKYLGLRVAFIRNLCAFITALIVAIITGFYFGEM